MHSIFSEATITSCDHHHHHHHHRGRHHHHHDDTIRIILIAAASLVTGMIVGSVLTTQTTSARMGEGYHDHDHGHGTHRTTGPSSSSWRGWWWSPRRWWPSSWTRHSESQQQQQQQQGDPKEDHLSARARDIDQHLRDTQIPARALGIRVYDSREITLSDHNICGDDDDDGDGDDNDKDGGTGILLMSSLTLEAPLQRNRNVHHTAFAGSLFSLGVLTSFYIARQYLITALKEEEADRYTLVARSATIRYRKPVTSPYIRATSELPTNDDDVLRSFLRQLRRTGKAMIHVPGAIYQNDTTTTTTTTTASSGQLDTIRGIACEYSVECCAYVHINHT